VTVGVCCCQVLVCLVCPLLIPWLVRYDRKDDNNTSAVNTIPNINTPKRNVDASCNLKAFYYFYTAPIVKFFCHSVSAGILTWMVTY